MNLKIIFNMVYLKVKPRNICKGLIDSQKNL